MLVLTMVIGLASSVVQKQVDVASAAEVTPGYQLKATIPIAGSVAELDLLPTLDHALVRDNEKRIWVINTATRSIDGQPLMIPNDPDAREPWMMKSVPSLRKVYVSYTNGNGLTQKAIVGDLESRTFKKTPITLNGSGWTVTGMVADDVLKQVFLVTYFALLGGSIYRIDGTTDTSLPPVAEVELSRYDMVINTVTHTLFVLVSYRDMPMFVVSVDIGTGKTNWTSPALPDNTSAFAVNEKTNEVYVSSYTNSRPHLFVLNGQTGAMKPTLFPKEQFIYMTADGERNTISGVTSVSNIHKLVTYDLIQKKEINVLSLQSKMVGQGGFGYNSKTGESYILDTVNKQLRIYAANAPAGCSSTDLTTAINQFATNSNTRINQVLTGSQQAAKDGDFFAAQKQADEVKLIADGLVDSVAVLGAAVKTVDVVKDMTKVELPGVAGQGWGHITQLKHSSQAAKKAFDASLRLPVTGANAQIAGKALLNDAYKYYAADMLDTAAEDLLTDQAIERGLQIGLQGDLALQSRMYPALERLSNDFKQDIMTTATNSAQVLPCSSVDQRAVYILDLNKRGQANIVIQSTWDQRRMPLHNAYIARVSHQDTWIPEFLLKYFLKSGAGIAFDGGGVIAVEAGAAFWNLYQNSRRLNEDINMMTLGINSVGGALDTQKRLYLNTVHGIDNVTKGILPQVPTAQVNSISNKSIGEYKVFGQMWWWERESYSEINLSSSANFETRYQGIATYGKTGILDPGYVPLVAEGTAGISSNRSGVIRIPYKGDDTSGGFSPDKDSMVTINILGNTDTGVYSVLNTSTQWQPERVTTSRQNAVHALATIQQDSPSLPYPIRARVDVLEDNMAYIPRLWVDNPFTQTVRVTVTQPIPPGVQVVNANGGAISGQTISWSQDIAPQTTIELAHTVTYSGAAGTVLTYPSAQLIMSDDSTTNSATFTSDSATFRSETPLVGEGSPFGQIFMRETASIPMTITNRAPDTSAGTVHITLTDLNGVQVYTHAQNVNVPGAGNVSLAMPLQGPSRKGTYILSATIDSNGRSHEIFSTYLEVKAHNVFLPSVRR